MGSPPPQLYRLQNLHHPRRARHLLNRSAQGLVEEYIACIPHVQFSIVKRTNLLVTFFSLFSPIPTLLVRLCGNFLWEENQSYLLVKLPRIDISQRAFTHIFCICLELISSIRRLSDGVVRSGSCVVEAHQSVLNYSPASPPPPNSTRSSQNLLSCSFRRARFIPTMVSAIKAACAAILLDWSVWTVMERRSKTREGGKKEREKMQCTAPRPSESSST